MTVPSRPSIPEFHVDFLQDSFDILSLSFSGVNPEKDQATTNSQGS